MRHASKRYLLAAFAAAAPLALAACGGSPERETVIVQPQPTQTVVTPRGDTVVTPQGQPVVVPPGSTVRTCTQGTVNCP